MRMGTLVVRSSIVAMLFSMGCWTASSASPSTLAVPNAITPFVAPALAGEGVWHPAGRRVNDVPAIYTTLVRPPGNPSTEAGVAWINTSLVSARLYSGSLSPGGYSWKYTAPISPSAATTLIAAFNGGFQMKDAHGGYMSEGRIVSPLVPRAASLVIYRDGSATVGAWDRDVHMTPDVVAVRQNLTLLVRNGAVVPGLNPHDVSQWGVSLNGVIDTPRSALGVTSGGALIYVEGEMNIVDLAKILVRAGALRAMVLDMNPYWTVFSTYTPATPTGAATPANGVDLTPSMYQTPERFFETRYNRDFITLSVRP